MSVCPAHLTGPIATTTERIPLPVARSTTRPVSTPKAGPDGLEPAEPGCIRVSTVRRAICKMANTSLGFQRGKA